MIVATTKCLTCLSVVAGPSERLADKVDRDVHVGDVFICMRCGAVAIFETTDSFRWPTDDELKKALANPSIAHLRKQIQNSDARPEPVADGDEQ